MHWHMRCLITYPLAPFPWCVPAVSACCQCHALTTGCSCARRSQRDGPTSQCSHLACWHPGNEFSGWGAVTSVDARQGFHRPFHAGWSDQSRPDLLCERPVMLLLCLCTCCRCGGSFCCKHRYAEEHSCTFDYKAAGKESLTRENPVVTAPKLPKI